MKTGKASRPLVLLTGASGFVGRQVAARLSASVELHCVSRKPRAATGGTVTWHVADLLDAAACERLVASVRPSHLVHLAWHTAHGEFWTAPDNMRWRDTGMALVRAFGRAGGKRLLICGTGAEYATSAPSPLDENGSLVAPETLYGQAKNALRIGAQEIADDFGIAFAWARIFNAFGAGEDRRRLVPGIIGAIMRNEPAKCSSGRQVRDFIDVRDLGGALAMLALSDLQGPINLGSGRQAKIAEIAQAIGRLMGRPELIALGALPDRPGEPLHQVPRLTRMRDELGFAPRIGHEQGLRDAISWWRSAAGDPGWTTPKQFDMAGGADDR